MKGIYFKTITALLLLATNVASAAIPLEEREALIKLYHATGGEQQRQGGYSNWLGAVGSECSWRGVKCTEDGFHVKEINLNFDNLTGAIPAEIGQLSGLEYLFLSGNQLTSLPAEIGQLSGLKDFHLINSQLTSLPAEIGQLSGLEFLDLGGNQLTSLPAEIGQLSGLKGLSLNDNQFTSLPAEIWQLSHLKSLGFSDNQLTSLPAEIGQLSGLKGLYLYNNQLTSLPAEIGQLSGLEDLNLFGNQLTSLPAEIGQLSGLEFLGLGRNQFTSLPAEIGQLSGLKGLDLRYNKLIYRPYELISMFKGREVTTHLSNNCSVLSQQCTLSSVTYVYGRSGRYDGPSFLYLVNVIVGGLHYYVELKQINNQQFRLKRAFLSNTATHLEPAHYDLNTQVLDIPHVFAFGEHYRVIMQNDGTNIFTIVDATVK